MTVQYIDTQADLDHFCQQIAHSPWVAVDTEFLREETYYPQLCLIQIANENHIACIDPLALADLTPLLDIIYHPEITVVFHAARQDLELFYLLRGALPSKVFDTQLAATVLGYGDQIAYANLVAQCLNIQLNKAHSRTDWTKRPLDSAQISYAADDVRYLRDVYKILLKQLAAKKRSHWLEEDFAKLINSNTYQANPENSWQKVKGYRQLKTKQLMILKQLAGWREQCAIAANRPRRWILKDDILLSLAKLAPDSLDQLTMIRGIQPSLINRYGKTLLAQIKQAKSANNDHSPILKKTPPSLSQQQQAVVDILMGLLRKLCEQQSITPVAVTSRKELERLVNGEKDLPLLQGWRNEIVGQHLQDFIAGKLTIRVGDDGQLGIEYV